MFRCLCVVGSVFAVTLSAMISDIAGVSPAAASTRPFRTIRAGDIANYVSFRGRERLACFLVDKSLGHLNRRKLAAGVRFTPFNAGKKISALKRKIRKTKARLRPASGAAKTLLHHRYSQFKKTLRAVKRARDACSGFAPIADLKRGLVLWMQFEDEPLDGIEDSSGYGHHGQCVEACANLTLASGAPQGKTALDFGSHGNYRDRPYFKIANARGSLMEPPEYFSYAFWFKPQGTSRQQYIFGASSTQGDASGYGIWYNGDSKKLTFQASHGDTVHRTIMTSKRSLDLNKWYQVTATWDGENFSLYIDGELDAVNSYPDIGPGSAFPLQYEHCSSDETKYPGRCARYGGDCRDAYVGVKTDWGNGEPCTERGLGSSAQFALDDLRMYNRTLSEIEVRALYHGAPGECQTKTSIACPVQYGVCAGASQSCANGTWPGCSDGDYFDHDVRYQAVESDCGDHMDNDCDSRTDDEDLDCNPISVSRFEGEAPLAVYFDAIGSQDWQAISNAKFVWDFGDGAEQDLSSGGRSFEGYLAAHVFETPGDYNVSVVMTPDGGQPKTFRKMVRVNPFSGRTLCVSSAADFSACPSAAAGDHFTDIASAWAQFGDRTNLLLRRGETWTVAAGFSKSTISGPSLIGAFGSGARPIINVTGDSSAFTISTKRDLRLADLEINGSNEITTWCTWSSEFCNNVLLLRIRSDAQGKSFVTLWSPDSDSFIVDSEFVNNGTYGYYSYGVEKLAIIKSRIKDASSHLARIGDTQRLLIYDSHFEVESSHPHDALTVRPDCGYSRYSLIKNNEFLKFGWNVQNGPQDSNTGGQLQYQILEGNYVGPYPGTQNTSVAFLLDGLDYVIRNNMVFDSSYGFSIAERDEYAGKSKRWRIYNNTFVTPYEGSFAVLKGRGPEDIRFFNNIYSAPANYYVLSFIDSADPSQVTADNNLWDVKHLTFHLPSENLSLDGWQGTYGNDLHGIFLSPRLASSGPGSANFLCPLENSPVIDAGATQPGLYEDFHRSPRPADGDGDGAAAPDIGACEYTR